MDSNKGTAPQRKNTVKNTSIASILITVVVFIFLMLFGEDGLALFQNGDYSSANGEISEVFKVHFIDVAQGDSILMENSQNEFMLIDTGERDQYEALKSYLDKQGVNKFKYVIFTHPHSDHIGSANRIVKEYDIETLIMPNVTHTTSTFKNLISEIEAKNMSITQAVAGDEYIFGNAKFLVIAPAKEDYKNLNDYSVVVKMTHGDVDFMFTGDMEKVSERDVIEFCEANGIDISVEVLKVAHHGSSTSSIQEILDLMRPEKGIIMCDGVSYNHPHGEVVERILALGTEIYRTDKNGSIVVTSDGKEFTVEVEVIGQ